MSILNTNIPYGKIWSTLGTSAKFMRPVMKGAAYGAAAGAAGSMISGDDSMLRDAGIGALGGIGLSKMGRSYAKTFGRGASAEAGILNVGAGIDSVKNRAMGRWTGINRING